jgi:hypothetical protein
MATLQPVPRPSKRSPLRGHGSAPAPSRVPPSPRGLVWIRTLGMALSVPCSPTSSTSLGDPDILRRGGESAHLRAPGRYGKGWRGQSAQVWTAEAPTSTSALVQASLGRAHSAAGTTAWLIGLPRKEPKGGPDHPQRVHVGVMSGLNVEHQKRLHELRHYTAAKREPGRECGHRERRDQVAALPFTRRRRLGCVPYRSPAAGARPGPAPGGGVAAAVIEYVAMCAARTAPDTAAQHGWTEKEATAYERYRGTMSQTAPKYVLKKPSKRIWGTMSSRGASGGGPGEIMISKTSSSVRLSVQFDHSISSYNYSPSRHLIATQFASSVTAITSHHLPFSIRSYTKGASVFFMVIISQPVLRSGVCPVPTVNCRS